VLNRSPALADPQGAPVILTKGEYAMRWPFSKRQQPLSREFLLQPPGA
jgi:hypothetical protein